MFLCVSVCQPQHPSARYRPPPSVCIACRWASSPLRCRRETSLRRPVMSSSTPPIKTSTFKQVTVAHCSSGRFIHLTLHWSTSCRHNSCSFCLKGALTRKEKSTKKKKTQLFSFPVAHNKTKHQMFAVSEFLFLLLCSNLTAFSLKAAQYEQLARQRAVLLPLWFAGWSVCISHCEQTATRFT